MASRHHRARLPRQRQFARDAEGIEGRQSIVFFQLQHPKGDRQIEAWSFLSHIGREGMDGGLETTLKSRFGNGPDLIF
jgi:hypothetical protein